MAIGDLVTVQYTANTYGQQSEMLGVVTHERDGRRSIYNGAELLSGTSAPVTVVAPAGSERAMSAARDYRAATRSITLGRALDRIISAAPPATARTASSPTTAGTGNS